MPISVTFTVATDEKLRSDEKIFVVGQRKEMGGWRASNALQMRRVSSSMSNEMWRVQLELHTLDQNDQSHTHARTPPSKNSNTTTLYYRYFIAKIERVNDEGPESLLLDIISWENSMQPRSIELTSAHFASDDAQRIDEYGCIGGQSRCVQTGWLHDASEAQFRLHSSPVYWYKHCNRFRPTRVLARAYKIPHSYSNCECAGEGEDARDDCGEEADTTDWNFQKKFSTILQSCKLAKDEWQPCENGPYGIAYQPSDYIIFQLHAFDMDDMVVEFEFYQQVNTTLSSTPSTESLDTNGSSVSSVMSNLSLMDSLAPHETYHFEGSARFVYTKNMHSQKTLVINSKTLKPIGKMKLDFLLIRPIRGIQMSMEKTFSRYWRQRRTLTIGHRGTGISFKPKIEERKSNIKENTVRALKTAASHGADYVEFDVQLSKDKVPIVYHDFDICVMLKKKNSRLQFMKIPVHELYMEQLRELTVEHTSALERKESIDIHSSTSSSHSNSISETELSAATPPSNINDRNSSHSFKTSTEEVEEDGEEENETFPTLKELLNKVDVGMGFNIELKYPQLMEDGDIESPHYFERNTFLDAIIKVVLEEAADRRIVFSSFDSDICVMAARKQNKYPVLFLTQGTCEEDNYRDLRTREVDRAIYFAIKNEFLGLAVLYDKLEEDPDVVARIQSHGLQIFVWGEKLLEPAPQEICKQAGVAAIIIDKIHHVNSYGTQNIFTTEAATVAAATHNHV